MGNSVLFSKQTTRRFPTEGEVEEALATRLQIEEELSS